MKILSIIAKSEKNSALFHLKIRVCLKYFVYDCTISFGKSHQIQIAILVEDNRMLFPVKETFKELFPKSFLTEQLLGMF